MRVCNTAYQQKFFFASTALSSSTLEPFSTMKNTFIFPFHCYFIISVNIGLANFMRDFINSLPDLYSPSPQKTQKDAMVITPNSINYLVDMNRQNGQKRR